MLVVSDTTPIISLLKINRLQLLSEMFHEVIVPESVYDELTQNERYAHEAQIIRKSHFIVRREISSYKEMQLLQRATGLDKGESEAIILADEIRADLLLMDEANGRNVASRMGLTITGTVGLLMRAYEEKRLSPAQIKDCVNELRLSRRFIDESLYEKILAMIESE